MRKRRTHKATKRPDMSALREAMRDRRVWCSLGKVLPSDDGGSHYSIDGGEILVDVEIQPSLEEVSAIVGSAAGGNGAGVWAIPPVGAEVIVAIPEGEVEFQPTIVSVLSSGTAADGLAENTIVIVAPTGGQVIVHDGSSGDAKELAYKSDVQAVVDTFNGHTHGYIPSGTGTPALSTGPATSPTGAPPVDSPDPEGTTVLKGK